MGDGFGGGDSSAQQTRGSYWKRGDSMRLIHLLTDPELKPLFIATESGVNGSSSSGSNSGTLTSKQFWMQAATKFNDDDWQPAHEFPNDPHLMRVRAFTPTKKSKEVDYALLRDKYKGLKKQFAISMKRWEQTGENNIKAFWKCSGVTSGTTDEGCWYLFLVVWVRKEEQLLSVLLDKAPPSQQTKGLRGQTLLRGPSLESLNQGHALSHGAESPLSGKRPRYYSGLEDPLHHDHAAELQLQLELKMESLFKQQTEALKYVCMCYSHLNDATEDDARAFWRSNLATAQAQLAHVQQRIPSQAAGAAAQQRPQPPQQPPQSSHASLFERCDAPSSNNP